MSSDELQPTTDDTSIVAAATDAEQNQAAQLGEDDFPADTEVTPVDALLDGHTPASIDDEEIGTMAPLEDFATESEVFGLNIDPIAEGFSVDVETGSHLSTAKRLPNANSLITLLRTTLGDALTRGETIDVDKLKEIHKNPEAVDAWEAAILEAMGTTSPSRDRGVKRVRSKNSRWTQRPQYQGLNLVPNRPVIGESTGSDTLLTGERAMLMMTAMNNPGAHLQIPLWDTGIWVTMRQPSLSADIEFIQRIQAERVKLGREGKGVLFSNDNVFITGYLYDYILAHIFDTTAKVNSMSELRGIIKATDIRSLAWGMANLLNPQAFPFSQPCTVDPNKCIHISEEMVSIAKMLWVDDGRLTEKQRAHMASRKRDVTPEKLKLYQEEFKGSVPDTFTLSDFSNARDGIKKTQIVLHTPTLEHQIEIGRRWINDIVTMTEAAFAQRLSGKEREIYMSEQAKATQVRKYSHWVKEIVFTKGDVQHRVTERDDIENALVAASSNREIIPTYMQHIDSYIEDQGLAIVGFPNYECPACKQWHLTPQPKQTIVPIDPVSVFLVLQHYRVVSAQPEESLFSI